MSEQKKEFEEASNTEDQIDLGEMEGQEASGGVTDQDTEEADTSEQEGEKPEGDEETPPAAEESEEVDLESIEIDGVSGSRPEQDDDEEKRKHNKHNARMRVKLKQKEQELEQLRQSQEGGYSTDDPKPKRTDFLSSDVLYDKYDGDATLARANYEDALEDWQDRARQRHNEKLQQLNQEVQREKASLEIQDVFEKHSGKWRGKVKGFDANIEKAEKSLIVKDDDGKEYDGSIKIKELYGEDAPLILAALGANQKLVDQVMKAPTEAHVYMILSEIGTKAKRAFTSSKKKVSRAQGEQSVKGDANTPTTSLEKALQKAADNKDLKEYQRLSKLIAQKRAS